MKLLALLVAMGSLLASTAISYVQVANLPQAPAQVSGSRTDVGTGGGVAPLPRIVNTDPGIGANHGISGDGAEDERPANPVPEPGTMTLASLGLIALGVAARRRRAR